MKVYKVYKVIKPFNNAIKGDIFFCDPDYDETVYQLERNEVTDNIQSTVYMEISKDIIDEFVKQGYLVECDEEDLNEDDNTENTGLENILEYVESLINQYSNDYNNMLKSFEEGDIQPCVKVEAETVYYNLNKVLNSIKDKIHEQIG